MPKPVKTSSKKRRIRPKAKAEQQPTRLTNKKSYWITLTTVFAIASAVFGQMQGFRLIQTVLLAITISVVIGMVGFIGVSPSSLSFSKRATFIFVGASVAGFGIWAVLAIVVLPQLGAIVDEFFIFTSFIICLAIGAFIGELIGRNKKVQERLFPFQNV